MVEMSSFRLRPAVRVTDNPMFTRLKQPRIGAYHAPSTPMSFDGKSSVVVDGTGFVADTVNAVAGGLRRAPARNFTGAGTKVVLPLEDVAFATPGNLGYIVEAQLVRPARPKVGNAVYGRYGSDFEMSDGARFMLVALTPLHFRDLTAQTGTTEAVTALESALGAVFRDEGTRYEHRQVLKACSARGSPSTPPPRSKPLPNRHRSCTSGTARSPSSPSTRTTPWFVPPRRTATTPPPFHLSISG